MSYFCRLLQSINRIPSIPCSMPSVIRSISLPKYSFCSSVSSLVFAVFLYKSCFVAVIIARMVSRLGAKTISALRAVRSRCNCSLTTGRHGTNCNPACHHVIRSSATAIRFSFCLSMYLSSRILNHPPVSLTLAFAICISLLSNHVLMILGGSVNISMHHVGIRKQWTEHIC